MDIAPEQLAICLEVLQQISEDPSVMDHHERFKSLVAKIHKQGKRGQRQATQERRSAADRQLRATTGIVRAQRDGAASDHLLAKAAVTGAPGASDGGAPALETTPVELPSEAAPVPPALEAVTSPQRASESAASAGAPRRLQSAAPCYICKQPYRDLHFFYHKLCPSCAELNYHKRAQRADLHGRSALITGGRVKIGYQTALRMLRDGARVLLTTRFPQDAALRFHREPDFDAWGERLLIFGLDLRDIAAVESFVAHLLQSEPALDIVVNNAAQTIKRPLAFYAHLLEQERRAPEALPQPARALLPALPGERQLLLDARPHYQGHLPDTSLYFPPNAFDGDGQQLDLRPRNSWLLKLDEVSTLEMLEVQLVNVVAPFILASQLKPLLLRSPFARRFIVNVSAMEGQFGRASKTEFHPHTNMAKAALNMLTRTSAQDYARDGIYMNSVDTGWITDENPHPKKLYEQDQRGFYTPLDIVDGMARIYDPIVQGLVAEQEPLYSHFLKDYAPYPW